MVQRTMTNCDEQEQSWVRSVVFWLCLFAAAALYAVVYLSPKLLVRARLSSRHHDNHIQLVTLQQHCKHLETVQTALQSDPGFRAELARIEFDAVDPAEQRIPVGDGLTLNAIAAAPHKGPPGSTLPWYTPVLEYLTETPRQGNCMLLVAAVLVMFGFVGLGRSTEGVAVR